MKLLKVIVTTGCLWLFFCCVAIVCVAAEQGREPYLLVEDPWPPYTVGGDGEVSGEGLIVELMTELFERIDQPLRMELYPWKRCIHMVRNQQADGLMLTVKTSEREQFLYFPEPFFYNKIQFYYSSAGEFAWNEFSDLKGLTIGVVAGSKYSQEFQDAISQFGLVTEEVNSISVNFNKLKAGHIDITPVLDVVAARIIEDDDGFRGQFKAASKPLRSTAMQMAIARSSKLMHYRDHIDGTIKEMKTDGTVKRVYEKYVSPAHP